MGRSIPSISFRLDEKMRQWERFAKLLNAQEREAFDELVAVIRNRRSAIDGVDEPDIGVAILLAIIVEMRGEINELKRRGKRHGDASGQVQELEDRGTKDWSEDRDALP